MSLSTDNQEFKLVQRKRVKSTPVSPSEEFKRYPEQRTRERAWTWLGSVLNRDDKSATNNELIKIADALDKLKKKVNPELSDSEHQKKREFLKSQLVSGLRALSQQDAKTELKPSGDANLQKAANTDNENEEEKKIEDTTARATSVDTNAEQSPAVQDEVDDDNKEEEVESTEPSSEDIQKKLRQVILEIMPLNPDAGLALLTDAGNLTTDKRHQRVMEILNRSSVIPEQRRGKNRQPVGEYISQLFKQFRAIENPDEKIWSEKDSQRLKYMKHNYLEVKADILSQIIEKKSDEELEETKSNLSVASLMEMQENKEGDTPRILILLGPNSTTTPKKTTHAVIKIGKIPDLSMQSVPGIVIVLVHGGVSNRSTKLHPTKNERGIIDIRGKVEKTSDVIKEIRQKTQTKDIAIFTCCAGSAVNNINEPSVVEDLEVGTKILLFGSSKHMTYHATNVFVINKLSEFYERNEQASIDEFFIESTIRDARTVMFSKVILGDDGRKKLLTVKSVAPKNPANIESVRNYLESGKAIIPRKDDEDHRRFVAELQAVLKQKSLLLTDKQIQEYEERALIEAANRGVVPRIEAWINKGVSVDASHRGYTPLIIAAYTGSKKIINILLAKGADVNQPNKDGDTALHIAAQERHLHVIKELVAKGADINQPNKDGDTALHIAAQEGHLHVIKKLVAKGAYVNQPDKDGDTALCRSGAPT